MWIQRGYQLYIYLENDIIDPIFHWSLFLEMTYPKHMYVHEKDCAIIFTSYLSKRTLDIKSTMFITIRYIIIIEVILLSVNFYKFSDVNRPINTNLIQIYTGAFLKL